MNWSVLVDATARKYIKRISKSDAGRIAAILKELVINPYGGDIEKMKGEKNVWRRRVGAYRIFYEIHISKRIIYVFDIQRRTSSTY